METQQWEWGGGTLNNSLKEGEGGMGGNELRKGVASIFLNPDSINIIS